VHHGDNTDTTADVSRKPSAIASAVASATLAVALAGCGASRSPPAPHDDRSPPELAVRTSRFRLVASASVEYAMAGPARPATFDAFLATAWPDRATRDRRAIDGAVPLLLDAEDLLGARLATSLELAWSTDPTPLVVTSAGVAPADDALEAQAIEVNGPCFEGAAILACAFHRAVLARRTASALLVAIDEERSKLDDAGKRATASLVRDVVAFAVGEAVRSVSRAYVPERHFPLLDPDTRTWLTREWPRRLLDETRREESASAFGARAVRELAAGKR
jgi:hypothetical protein